MTWAKPVEVELSETPVGLGDWVSGHARAIGHTTSVAAGLQKIAKVEVLIEIKVIARSD